MIVLTPLCTICPLSTGQRESPTGQDDLIEAKSLTRVYGAARTLGGKPLYPRINVPGSKALYRCMQGGRQAEVLAGSALAMHGEVPAALRMCSTAGVRAARRRSPRAVQRRLRRPAARRVLAAAHHGCARRLILCCRGGEWTLEPLHMQAGTLGPPPPEALAPSTNAIAAALTLPAGRHALPDVSAWWTPIRAWLCACCMSRLHHEHCCHCCRGRGAAPSSGRVPCWARPVSRGVSRLGCRREARSSPHANAPHACPHALQEQRGEPIQRTG